MKKIIRMFVFSGAALYLTGLWNRGFIVHFDPMTFAKAALLVGIVYYLLTPFLKMLLLPLNFITFGLASIIAYIALFYFVVTKFSIVDIREWTFYGYQLNYWSNLAVSSFSVATIINLLESLL